MAGGRWQRAVGGWDSGLSQQRGDHLSLKQGWNKINNMFPTQTWKETERSMKLGISSSKSSSLIGSNSIEHMVMKKWNDYKLKNGWHRMAWFSYSKFRHTMDDGQTLASPKAEMFVRIQHPHFDAGFFTWHCIHSQDMKVWVSGAHKVFLWVLSSLVVARSGLLLSLP